MHNLIAEAGGLVNVLLRVSNDEPTHLPPARKKQSSREGKKVVTVYLPESVWRDVKLLAARTDTAIVAIMCRGLDMVLMQPGVNRGAVEE